MEPAEFTFAFKHATSVAENEHEMRGSCLRMGRALKRIEFSAIFFISFRVLRGLSKRIKSGSNFEVNVD